MTPPESSPTIGAMLVQVATQFAERAALSESDITLSYADTLHLARRCAATLAEYGISPGDRVAILLPNGIPYAIWYLGAQLTGAIAVLVNARLSAPEIDYALSNSGASVVVSNDSFADRLPGNAVVIDAAQVGVDGPYNGSLPVLPSPARRADQAAQLLYTSGTTGRPKAAVQTHANLLFNAQTVRAQFELTADDKTLIVAPMFHATGMNSQLIAFLSGGASCVMVPGYKTADTLAALAEHRITIFGGVATMLQLMFTRPEFDHTDLSALRLIVLGGSPVPEHLPAEVKRRLPHSQLANVWGQTEATSVATFIKGDDFLARPWSAGRAVPGVVLGVSDDQATVQDRRGYVGELCIRGPVVVSGYWNQPSESASTFRGEWLHTGDVGTIDDEGFVQVLDRLKDMIIRGGENIYSLEVESVLAAHHAVTEVAVTGVPDEIFGERVRAVVVVVPGARLTSDELRDYASSYLADYKIPAEVVFVDELPRNPSGKVLKHTLAELPLTPAKTAG